MEYQHCGVQITCNNFSTYNKNYNNSYCTSGCFCISKYVLEDGMCIHPDTCPSKLYAKQKHLWCKKRRGQSEAAVI